jgi:hypothetical protein
MLELTFYFFIYYHLKIIRESTGLNLAHREVAYYYFNTNFILMEELAIKIKLSLKYNKLNDKQIAIFC